jgi:uncharacterized ferredoxin-like protein
MILKGKDAEEEGIITVAKLMANSARTAPKTAGIDDVEIVILTGEEMSQVIKEMERMAEERGANFIRDAKSCTHATAMILIGVKGGNPAGLDCGACGFNCAEFREQKRREGRDYVGPSCAFKLVDLGIALGSAVKTAQIHNIDNRIMFRIGTAAKRLGYVSSDIVLGIPLASTGKNPFFDRR